MKLFSTPPVLSGKKNKKRKKLLKAQRKALKRADHPFESDKAADCRGVVLSNPRVSLCSERGVFPRPVGDGRHFLRQCEKRRVVCGGSE